MNLRDIVLGLMLMAVTIPSALAAGKVISPESMGLSKGSVFEVPEQRVYRPAGGPPGQNKALPRAYLNAPPQISHDIGDFLPITAQSNLCIACHNLPGQWGKAIGPGEARPIPRSHYTDLRNAPGQVGEQPVGARYNCNQCHVPQDDAKPLVENRFSAGARR